MHSAARSVICDNDVGNVKPVAQRVRKVAPQFREKLSDLIKGLLGAKTISVSTSPWVSPIVVIIKRMALIYGSVLITDCRSNKDESKLDESGSDEVSTDPSQDELLDPIKPSVLGQRSYIDDILVTAGSLGPFMRQGGRPVRCLRSVEHLH
ncbi:unnamed protein product [Phytophthora fragariaefolia]|uniref:Unnamed protein product n=1 Tax=Phytophthora fragariaefolia TaxID=1490495 RepID=A0A9W6X4P4_9STRA|nr:unnamed protein product [Phytophthora fragariaefolia]